MEEELPIARTNIVSYVTYAWLDRFMWRAFRQGLTTADIWRCPSTDGAQVNCTRLEEAWQQEQKEHGNEASLTRTSFRYVKQQLIIGTIILILSLAGLVITVAYFLLSVLSYTVLKNKELYYGILMVGALFIADIIQNILFIAVFTITHTAGTRLRSGALTMVYRKLLTLRVVGDKISGNMMNVFANDSVRIFDGVSYAPTIFTAPILALAVTAYACFLLGPWPLIGFVIIILLFPTQMFIGKIMMGLREKAIALTDQRVCLMSEILSHIKLIKMYAWEVPFTSAITDIRSKERKVIEKVNLTTAVAFSISMVIVAIATISTIMALTLSGHDLSPAKAFTYLAVFTSIQGKLMLSMLAVKHASELKVATERIQSILGIKQEIRSKQIPNNRQSIPPDSNYIVDVRSASLAWPATISQSPDTSHDANNSTKPIANHTDNHEEKEMKPMISPETDQNVHSELALRNISLKVEKGEVIGVAGGVGSGKTAFISALLGQLDLEAGDVIVRAEVAYVPQVPWIINGTVKDNIVFGHTWDEKRYDRIVSSCGLSKDLEALAAGDATEIGEQGTNLSGGQKQRISLARAVFSDRDIYLLDDPFSAVDPDIAEKLFEQVVLNELVGKTVILVTHQTKFLSRCDRIVFLQNGSLVECGTHEDLVDKEQGLYVEFINNTNNEQPPLLAKPRALSVLSEEDSELGTIHSNDSINKTLSTSKTTLRQLSQSPALHLIRDEEQEQGAVTLSTYWSYICCGGGVTALLLVMLFFMATEGLRAFSYWWLAYWIAQGSGNRTSGDNSTQPSYNISENPRLGYYNLVYGLSLLALILALSLRALIYSKVALKASSNMHRRLLKTVMHLPMRFFETTPLGQIINRFSKDMDEMDSRLPPVMDQTIQCLLAMLTYLIMIGVVINWFLLAVPPLAVIFLFLYAVFRSGSRDLQRLQSISTSPLLGHISTTINGLPSIHAYDKTSEFYDKFVSLLDQNSVMLLLFNLSQRWVNLRLSLVTTIAVSLTALLIVLLPDHVMPAYAGLAIVYASQLSTIFQFFVKMAVDTETKFVSAERINTYIKRQDDDMKQVGQPPSSSRPWPSSGQVKFVDFSTRYREGLPLVLTNINVEIQHSQKIGIVGRTGSGKSSLVAALFRLIEASNGRIEIDGVDISHLSLTELRSNLSVIPQEPVLFKGTVRTNLDPTRRSIDHELWRALDKCHMKDVINLLDEKLDAPVSENGENFSYGQRQLLCMARVLLRHSKVVVLDEATASVDSETDTLIQKSLRDAFTDCTMLIIAHRLSTVMDLDKLIVIDSGKIVEMDTPSNLMAKKNSLFNRLMALGQDTGSSSSVENIPSDAWV